MPQSRARPTYYTVTLLCGADGQEAYWVIASSKDAAAKQARRLAGRECTVLEVSESGALRET